MTDAERAVDKAQKAVDSAQRHIEYFRSKEAEHRALIEKGGPYPEDEAQSFAMSKYYGGRVREHEAALRDAEGTLAALRRPPLA